MDIGFGDNPECYVNQSKQMNDHAHPCVRPFIPPIASQSLVL